MSEPIKLVSYVSAGDVGFYARLELDAETASTLLQLRRAPEMIGAFMDTSGLHAASLLFRSLRLSDARVSFARTAEALESAVGEELEEWCQLPASVVFDDEAAAGAEEVRTEYQTVESDLTSLRWYATCDHEDVETPPVMWEQLLAVAEGRNPFPVIDPIDYAEVRVGSDHEESVERGGVRCAVCGWVDDLDPTSEAARMWHGDTFDIEISSADWDALRWPTGMPEPQAAEEIA